MHRFDGTNTTGVYRIKMFFYFFTEESRQTCYPCPLNNAWKDKVMEAASNVLVLVISTSTRSSTSALDMMPTAVDTGDTGEQEDVDEESPSKQQRVDGCDVGPLFQSCSYWPDSPEAYHLFKPRSESVSRRIGACFNGLQEHCKLLGIWRLSAVISFKSPISSQPHILDRGHL